MKELLDKINKDAVVFVNSLKELEDASGLSKKQLCIAKTDFKDLYLAKKYVKKFPNLDIWLTSPVISRKDIIAANSCGVKDVIPYPVDVKLINNYFKKQNASSVVLPQQYGSLKGLKVAVVDDNQMNIDLLVETLSALDLKISTFIKPIEASKAVEIEKFDLFLLDIMMPEMSGFELASIIKKSKLNANAPIMFISALSDADYKITGYNIGSCAYIEKPFDVNVVRSQIHSVLKTKCLQDALNDKKETFLAMVTHDLKTPIYAEISALELLRKSYSKNLDGMQTEIITDILSAAKYMKNLVENLLQKYKCESENLKLNKYPNSLKDVIIGCIEETQYLFEDKELKYVFNCSVKNSVCSFDEIEIKRVIHNLLINTVEHGIRKSRVIIDLKETSKEFIFSIVNFGTGFVLKNPDEIFLKYVTYAQASKKASSGLGLYIAKRIIDAHGGKIKAESEPNKYVKFIFTLPKK